MSIDRADDHLHDAETWPRACRHVGLFLWWAAERGLASERHDPEEVRRAPTEYLSACDGKLIEDDLTEQGNTFASRWYRAYLSETSAYARTLGVGDYEVPEGEATTRHFFAWLDGRLASEPGVDALTAVPVQPPVPPTLVGRLDVLFVEEQYDYLRLHTTSGDHLIQMPISQLQERWQQAGFVRVHPRYLLAVSAVRELRSVPTGALVAHTDVGEVPVSREHERELRQRLLGAATRDEPDGEHPRAGGDDETTT